MQARPLDDQLRRLLPVRIDGEIALRIDAGDSPAEAGAGRIEEHDVGYVEDGIAVVDDFERRRIGRDVVRDRDALRSQHPHMQHVGRTDRAAVKCEEHGPVRAIVGILRDVRDSDEPCAGPSVRPIDVDCFDDRLIGRVFSIKGPRMHCDDGEFGQGGLIRRSIRNCYCAEQNTRESQRHSLPDQVTPRFASRNS
jgi:hypothetical protein